MRAPLAALPLSQANVRAVEGLLTGSSQGAAPAPPASADAAATVVAGSLPCPRADQDALGEAPLAATAASVVPVSPESAPLAAFATALAKTAPAEAAAAEDALEVASAGEDAVSV